ncbi:MAG: hypothetical protein ACTHJW_27495 [Streptosporangiaceae bacterium]
MPTRTAAALAIAVIAALVASCASGSAASSRQRHVATRTSGPVRAGLAGPGQFISLRFAPKSQQGKGPDGFLEVAVSRVRTGAIVRRLLPAGRDGMQVDGLSLDRSGNLWVTYSKGPISQGDLVGGDPKPHSCANEIAILHASSGRLSVFLRTSNNVLISGAAVSPDGGLLAYRESGCATGYFNDHLRVTDIRTRDSWTIGAGLARCHFIADPAWVLGGRALLVGYAAHVGRSYTGPQGTCSGIGPERLVELNPSAQPGLVGHSFGAGRGCQITSVAGTYDGRLLAIEACGGSYGISGPARLLVLDAHFRPVRQIALGRCSDGNELSMRRAGRSVLVSAYLYCNPPGRPGPVTRLWSYVGGKLRLIASVPGDTLGVSLMTW